ncbi:MAG: lipoprotein-releasing ABC transporter permease subunit [Chromatiales bacterium]|nr:lipoprotein-releasing ABC transporter permease subunit [Chromatiales bacterium]
MIRPWELAIALRYVRSRNKSRFVSFISVTSMAGIGVGVAVLIIVLSVMNGFEYEVRDRILKVVAHASISGFDGRLPDWEGLARLAAEDPEVESAAPYIAAQGMLVGPREVRGVEVRGIEPAAELATSAIGELLTAGQLTDLAPGDYAIVLGSGLADALGVVPGDRVILMIAEGTVTPAGVVPRMRRFTVSGLFHAGMYEYDQGLALVHLRDAATLWRKGDDVTGLRLSMREVLTAPVTVRELARRHGGGVYVTDWTRQHANFFRSIQITRTMIFLILLLVVAVAAFNIVSTLVMVVRDKRGEVAILRTLGTSPAAVLAIFVLQGALIGLIGTGLGALAGVAAAANIDVIVALIERLLGFRFLAPDVYFISDFPSRILWSDVLRVSGIALLLALLSTLYPAWRAARMAPAQVLRYE